MCNLIITHTHTHTHTHTRERGGGITFESATSYQARSFHTRHHLCRQEVAPAGSHQLRAQERAPIRQYGTEGRTGHQRREGGYGDGYKDGDGHEDGNGREDGDGSENGDGDGDENGNEGGGERVLEPTK